MKKEILTEKRNPNSINIDQISSLEILKIINNEDKTVALAVEKELKNIAKAVDLIETAFLQNGNLLYFGAGTSGRLGVLDASECPPTFSVPSDMVRGYIAGGDTALRNAVEGAEDSYESGEEDIKKASVKETDIVVGISASGNAPYVQGVLAKARETGAKTIAIACNKSAKIKELADVFICPEVGAEVVTGSTRLKAGTAQKMVLNMLTTASMVRIGKTYENYMIDVKPSNIKLKDRATRIVSEITETDYEEASAKLKEANYEVKTAVVMSTFNVSYEEAAALIRNNKGRLRDILNKIS